jgi:UDP-glucose:(heptosyl)LPS alpha-1,3-glucosyltransferase
MRIGFQIEHLDPARGGAETYVDRFSRTLLAAGHEVHVFTEGHRDLAEGVKVHTLRRYTAHAAQTAAEAEKLDVVVGVGKCLGMNVYQPHGGTFLGSRRQNLALIRNPVNRWIRGVLNHVIPKHRAAAALEAEQYAQTAPRPHFVAISQMVRDDMRRFHNVPDDRLHLVYNGVDTEAFRPERCAELRPAARSAWGLSPRTTCFVLVAHNFRLKGVRELIEAAALVRRHDRDFVVIVVGKGNAAPYERLARKFAADGVVRFVGAMRDVLPAYAAADAYLQPTWYDPCSLVVLEAWACGLPVVTTKFNGAGELMTPGAEGFVIDTPADTQALADRMIELLDADVRAIMAPAARALAERHALDDNFRGMMAVFERAAAERNPA